jgi:integrase
LMQRKDTQDKLVWYVRLYHHGKERRFGAFPNKTKARDFYEEAKKNQRDGQFFPERYQKGGYEPVATVIDRYLETAKTKKAYRDEQYFGRWWKAWFKDQRLNAITPERIDEARQSLLKDGRTPQRVNRYQAWLRQVLNISVMKGKLSQNPVTQLKMFKEPKGRTRFLIPDEEAKLIKALGPRFGACARFAILTGLRQKEQFGLQWKDVDMERGLLTLMATKSGDVQYAPLNQEAQAFLESLDTWQSSKWVFPSQNPATHVDPTKVRRKYRKAVKLAGIPWVTWHDLRHTFASRLAMRGVPLATIAALLRHSTTCLVKRYAHLSPAYLKEAVEEVSVFGRTKKETPDREAQPEGITPISDGTVTKTGTREGTAESIRA